MENPYADLIARTASTYSLDAALLTAQVQVESSFDPFAFRHEHSFFEHYIRHHQDAAGFRYGPLAACSFGLLQILLETALELGYGDRPERLFVPQVGLAWGAKYLQTCIKRANNDYRIGLRYYNGQGPEAEAYATKIFALAGRV